MPNGYMLKKVKISEILEHLKKQKFALISEKVRDSAIRTKIWDHILVYWSQPENWDF